MAELKGRIVSVTASGDLVTDIQVSALGSAPRDDRLLVFCQGHRTNGLYPIEHGLPEMTFFVFENDASYAQISIVGGDASRFLGIDVGSDVLVQW